MTITFDDARDVYYVISEGGDIAGPFDLRCDALAFIEELEECYL